MNYNLKRENFGFSRENIDGSKGGGSKGKVGEKLSAFVIVKPQETVTVMEANRSGVITHMWFGGILSNAVIVRAYYENSEFPSIEAPAPALFGMAYDKCNYMTNEKGEKSYPTMMSSLMMIGPSRGYNCYMEIPFRNHIKMTVENRGNEDIILYYMISGYYQEVSEDACYLHALYNQAHPLVKGEAYEVCNIEGEGEYIGTLLAMGLNGNSSCFVEGEVKVYIDDDIYPTLNYTGTEDYFCGSYAFGNDSDLGKYQTYSGLYAGMYATMGDTHDRYNTQQRFYFYRWHVLDAIVFHKNLRLTLDDLGWTGTRYDDYTSVAFYYLTKPTKLPYVLPKNDEICMK